MIVTQEADPEIVDSRENVLNLPENINFPVYCSSLKRGVMTLKNYFQLQDIIPLDELREVRFHLDSLLTNEEYEEFGSDLVRERFLLAFIADSLDEKREEIKNRVLSLIERLSKLSEGSYLVVSHSFFLKILEVYFKDKSLFDNPEILKDHFDPKKKMFEFGQGFDVLI